ncbi:UPF0547 protein C16orf87 homolog [Phlebotomus argentipes]|uniref:UPF0547 protein C16orf87 homolog n=1 Tax=Phlebotomus argentipes TaxID=94469 RepID=UPI002893212A|nr:UPF0547 protein C16orf87 homolog [Phlebotomus argentipes]
MIKKACPACKLQVAVACKSCKCGHSFFNARARRNSQKIGEEGDGQKRRTGRVRREKPQFYDPSKFENKRKRNKRKNSTKYPIEPIGKGPKGGRLRGPRRKTKKEEEESGSDAISQLSEEKQKIASIILAEINQKLGSVVWNPK